MHGVTGNNARHTTTEINMKVSFVLDNETTDYMAAASSQRITRMALRFG
jgi:hypothetical protein